jgi:hypothetical protein
VFDALVRFSGKNFSVSKSKALFFVLLSCNVEAVDCSTLFIIDQLSWTALYSRKKSKDPKQSIKR